MQLPVCVIAELHSPIIEFFMLCIVGFKEASASALELNGPRPLDIVLLTLGKRFFTLIVCGPTTGPPVRPIETLPSTGAPFIVALLTGYIVDTGTS